MKALSIQQPWAWAILYGGKDIENRTWPTHYTGSFLVHAGKKFDHEGYRWIYEHQYSLFPLIDIPHRDNFPMGGIVGKSNIIDCVSHHTSPFFFGPWGFVLKDSIPLKFISYRGKLGFFNVDINPKEFIKVTK